MNKNFVIVAIIAFIGLGIFLYFIFGLNGGSDNTSKENTQAAVSKVPSNLKIEDIVVGKGQVAKTGDTVVMNYTGTLTDGTKFDSSYDRGTPFETQIGTGQVIKGWDLGVPGMKVGGKRRLTIPPELGYGSTGAGDGKIPPNSTLIFEMELVGIK